MRRRRPVPGRGRPRGDAPSREHARQGLLRGARRDDRAPPRRARGGDRAPRAVTRLGRGERRSRSSRAPRPAARRGRRGHRGRPPRERGRGARRRGVVADHARGEGRPVADQRNAVHDRHGVPRARPRPAAGACRGRGVRDVGGGAPGDADELPPGDPRGAAACRPAAQCGDAARAARRLGDRRVAPVVRQGAGRVLVALRATGARGQPRPPRPRRADGRCRAERGDRQPARPPGGGAHRLERQLPRPADRDRARLHRDRMRGAREHQRAADGAAREPEPVGRPAARSWSRARRGSTRAS